MNNQSLMLIIINRFIETIEKKNSWGKNEIIELIRKVAMEEAFNYIKLMEDERDGIKG